MLREVHIDKYNKVITQFRPQSLSSLNIVQSKPYSKSAQQYIAIDDSGVKYQVYITEKDILPIQDDLVFLEQSPKVLLLKAGGERIIIEENLRETLEEFLMGRQVNAPCAPFMLEFQAKQLFLDLRISLEDYVKHSIEYSVIHPKNIVSSRGEWQFSLVGLLLMNQHQSVDYYHQSLPKDKALLYTLGTLLFKVLFGFVPFQKQKTKEKFSFKDYIKSVSLGKDNKKLLKMYYYAQRLLEVSQNAKELIQRSLEGNISYSEFWEHQFFKPPGGIPKIQSITQASKQIKMISLFGKGSDQAYQSLVMAAIQRKKNYPLQKINLKSDLKIQNPSEIIESFKKSPYLNFIVFAPEFKAKQQQQQQKSKTQNYFPTLDLPYFYQNQFDVQNDYPCRQLMKITDKESDQIKQAKIKSYAYPYVMIFQLYKYEALQPVPIRKKMRLVYDFLLQVSSLQSPPIKPLHDTKKSISSFDQIKIKYRQVINQLYHYFMAEAMKKYNIKKDSIAITQRLRQKQLGLQYYRLCLKLLQASLIVRKQGRDLDLHRIQTSQRKQIESDLTHLLKQYFPNKVEIY